MAAVVIARSSIVAVFEMSVTPIYSAAADPTGTFGENNEVIVAYMPAGGLTTYRAKLRRYGRTDYVAEPGADGLADDELPEMCGYMVAPAEASDGYFTSVYGTPIEIIETTTPIEVEPH